MFTSVSADDSGNVVAVGIEHEEDYPGAFYLWHGNEWRKIIHHSGICPCSVCWIPGSGPGVTPTPPPVIPSQVTFHWSYQSDGTRDLVGGVETGITTLGVNRGLTFATGQVGNPVADIYYLDLSAGHGGTGPGFWANNGSGGVHDLGAVTFESVTEAPDKSLGVGIGQYYNDQETPAVAGHVYVIVTKDGECYAKLIVDSISIPSATPTATPTSTPEGFKTPIPTPPTPTPTSTFPPPPPTRTSPPTPPHTYSISGYVRTDKGTGIGGVRVSFSGGHGSNTSTSSGYYSKSGFEDGTYTVRPEKTDYDFSPTSRQVTISGSNQSQPKLYRDLQSARG